MTDFQSLGLSEPILRALKAEGYTSPTPIQAKAVPVVLDGKDLLACAQTGTGKTAAFALPIIERLAANRTSQRVIRVLVLAPTRELAEQIHQSFIVYSRHAGLRSTAIYGKVSQHHQVRNLQRGVDVLIATPGRLLDLLGQGLIDLSKVSTFVLDEADRMLDMGFIHDVRKIGGNLPRERQTLLFSATLPREVRDVAAQLMNNPTEVQATPESSAAPKIEQGVYMVSNKNKRPLLVHLLGEKSMSRVIVFTRTKHGADRLQKELSRAGVKAEALHGNKSQNARQRALEQFKGSRPPVLVATDLASRGIDVDCVSHVVNFDLPHEPETYVHRIGRTGRAGESGMAMSFCDDSERSRLRAIERMLRKNIPLLTQHGDYRDDTAIHRGESDIESTEGAESSGGEHGSRPRQGRPSFGPRSGNSGQRRKPRISGRRGSGRSFGRAAPSGGSSSNGGSSNGGGYGSSSRSSSSGRPAGGKSRRRDRGEPVGAGAPSSSNGAGGHASSNGPSNGGGAPSGARRRSVKKHRRSL